MRGSVDQRYGLPRYRVWATMAIEDDYPSLAASDSTMSC